MTIQQAKMNELAAALTTILAQLDQLAQEKESASRTKCMVAALHVHQAIEVIGNPKATGIN